MYINKVKNSPQVSPQLQSYTPLFSEKTKKKKKRINFYVHHDRITLEIAFLPVPVPPPLPFSPFSFFSQPHYTIFPQILIH